MNIFLTSTDPRRCAQDHCTIHVNKMIIEYAQMLSTAHHVHQTPNTVEYVYKPTHEHRDCVTWVQQSSGNYLWMYSVLTELCQLYQEHRKKSHKTAREQLTRLQQLPEGIPDNDVSFVNFPLGMPKDCQTEDPIESYIAYLNMKFYTWLTRTNKRKLQPKWDLRVPDWINETIFICEFRTIQVRQTEKPPSLKV